MFRLDYNSDAVRNSGSYKYWKNRLSAGNSYKLTLADMLVDAFDYPLVFVDSISYSLDQDELIKLADVICRHCFNGNTDNVKLECHSIKGINDCIDDCLLHAGIFETGIDVLSCNTAIIHQDKITHVLFNACAFHNVKFKDVVLDIIHAFALCLKSEAAESAAVNELGWKSSCSTSLFDVKFSTFDMFNGVHQDLRKAETEITENAFYVKNVDCGKTVVVLFR